MFFARRRWALRVTERMGLDSRAAETTELVDMILQGAKQLDQQFRSVGQKMSAPELVLSSTAILANNKSAMGRLATNPHIGVHQALVLTAQAHDAGRALAIEQGYTEMVAAMYDAEDRVQIQPNR